MRWIRNLFLLLVFLLLGAGIFSSVRVLKDPEALYGLLGKQIETQLGTRLSAEEIKIAFTPFPALRLEKPRLDPGTGNFPSITAERAQFAFRLLPLLFGQTQLSSLQIREGKTALVGIPFEHFNFKMKGLKPNAPAPFEWKGSVAGGRETFQGKGKLSYKNPSGNLWADLGIQADIKLQIPSLAEGLGESFQKRFPHANLSGELEGSLHVEKEKGAKTVRGLVKFQAKDFRSGTSKGFSLAGDSNLVWNFEKGEVAVESLLLQSSFGEADIRGNFQSETGEIEEVRVVARKVVLDEVIRHFPNLQAFLPVDVGFSGESDFDLSFQGTWDYLSLHGNWNLTPAILSYGKFFLKPKDFPMGANFDLLLKGGKELAGDFSIRIRQSTIKGALPNLDLKAGVGEVTILTNKFDLEAWDELLPAFAGYQFSGAAKILVSCKGNLGQLETTEKLLNLTLVDVTLLSPRGTGLRGVRALVDLSPLNLRIKDAALEVAGSPVQFEAEIYNFQDVPQGTLNVSSPRLDLVAFVQMLRELRAFSPTWGSKIPWRKVQRFLRESFPGPAPLEQFNLNFKAGENKLIFENLGFRVLDGDFTFRGEIDWPAERPRFWVEAEVEKLSLAKYFETLRAPERAWEGNLFFQGRFEGEGLLLEGPPSDLQGRGSVSVTNGEWHGLRLGNAIEELEVFGDLSFEGAGDHIRFHDLKTGWTYKEGKFQSEDFLLHSDNFWVEGKGTLSPQGILNLRLDTYLSKPLTQDLLNAWGVDEEADERQVGPIPFLLVGSLAGPELKSDEGRMEDFLEAVREHKLRKILHEPFVKEKTVTIPAA